MAYITYEQSDDSAFPTELFMFSSTAFAANYYYTSADEEISYNGNIYKPIELVRSSPEATREIGAALLELTVPRNTTLAKLWSAFVPARTVWLTVYRYHRSETGSPEVVTFWQGKVRGVTWNNNLANIQCLPIDAAFSRNGLRVSYSGTCRHSLYGSRCKVPLNSFKKEATITAISGNKIYSPQFVTDVDNTTVVPDGWWVAGFLSEPVTSQLAYVTNHVGTEVELLVPIVGLVPGDVVEIAAGCDHKSTTCSGKFANIENYGGLGLYISDRNPFTIKLNE